MNMYVTIPNNTYKHEYVLIRIRTYVCTYIDKYVFMSSLFQLIAFSPLYSNTFLAVAVNTFLEHIKISIIIFR